MIRAKFSIDNGSGSVIQLNGENGVVFTDVTGLGAEFSESYVKISDGYFSSIQRENAQQTIAGTLIFKGANCKELYSALADYLLATDKLTLVYQPNGSTSYKRDISVNFLTRGPASWNLLQVPTSFICLTPWYTEETLSGTGSISVTAGGHIGTSIVLTTQTALTNPHLTLTDAGGVFAEIDMTLSTESGKTLEYSNDWSDSHIYYDGSDAIGVTDITNPLFGHSNKAFTISLPGASISSIVRKWWRTV